MAVPVRAGTVVYTENTLAFFDSRGGVVCSFRLSMAFDNDGFYSVRLDAITRKRVSQGATSFGDSGIEDA